MQADDKALKLTSLLLRLCALIPPPPPPIPRPTLTPHGSDHPARGRRLAWAELLKRSFGLAVLACPAGGHRMRPCPPSSINDPMDLAAHDLRRGWRGFCWTDRKTLV